MSSAAEDRSRTTTRRTVRRWRRIEDGRERFPFVPFGLLPLLGLLALALIAMTIFARGAIERNVERAAAEALETHGASWADVDVSGQWVVLSGSPPSRSAADAAVAAILDQRRPAMFGNARPATRVIERFSFPAGGAADAGASGGLDAAANRDTAGGSVPPPEIAPDENGGASQAADPPPPQPPGEGPDTVLRPPDWRFSLSDGVLRLEGETADEDARRAIIAAARDRMDPPRISDIVDALTIADVSGAEAWREIAQRGVASVAPCDSAAAALQGGVFSLRCALPEASADAVRQLASAPMPSGVLGPIEILTAEAVATCEQQLADLFDGASIEFPTNSASISPDSSGLLDDLAEAAATCPGTLRIEGHTDSDGSQTYNQRLSQRRAEAVRAALLRRGLAEANLRARGFGESQPIADNATEEGKARNRRIEINVVLPNDQN